MKKTKKKRKYNSENREAKAAKAKEQVLDLAIKLLVKYKDQFGIRKLSKESDCSERHLYRLFGGLEGLSKELNHKMNSILSLDIDMEKLSLKDLPQYVKKMAEKFNENEELVQAYLSSPLGHSSRKVWLDEKREKIRSIVKDVKNSEAATQQILILLSASFWQIIRSEAEMTAEESVIYIESMAQQIVKTFS